MPTAKPAPPPPSRGGMRKKDGAAAASSASAADAPRAVTFAPPPPPDGDGRYGEPPPRMAAEVPGLWQMSDSDRSSIWYGDDDFDAMEADAERVLAALALRERGTRRRRRRLRSHPGGNKPQKPWGGGEKRRVEEEEEEKEEEEVEKKEVEEDLCGRGLEHRASARASYAREAERRRVVSAVLDAQLAFREAEREKSGVAAGSAGSGADLVASASEEHSERARERARRTGEEDEEERRRLWAASAAEPLSRPPLEKRDSGFYPNFSPKLAVHEVSEGALGSDSIFSQSPKAGDDRSEDGGAPPDASPPPHDRKGGRVEDGPPPDAATASAPPSPTEARPVNGGKRSTKRVTFLPTPSAASAVHPIKGRWQLSPAESSAIWYDADEIGALESCAEREVLAASRRRLLRHHIQVGGRGDDAAPPEVEPSLRGLEHMASARVCYIRDKNRRRVAEAVMEEQMRREGPSDEVEEAIAAVSKRFSRFAAERARRIGDSDAADARGIEPPRGSAD